MYNCSVIHQTSKYNFSDGYYYTDTSFSGKKVKKLYVDNEEDSLRIYYNFHASNMDTTDYIEVHIPEKTQEKITKVYRFRQPSLDIDFLTIPFKYRPSTEDFPNQLNANLNGAIFIGYRTDVHQINYKKNPTGIFMRRKIN